MSTEVTTLDTQPPGKTNVNILEAIITGVKSNIYSKENGHMSWFAQTALLILVNRLVTLNYF